MELDEQGWDKLAEAMAAMLGTVVQIRHDARNRLAESGQPAIRVTYGQLGFESAPLPAATDK